MKYTLSFILSMLLYVTANAQMGTRLQYFDGADTIGTTTLVLVPDTNSGNIWQIGRPQKAIFDSALTFPNVIVTDTLNPYPINDSSSFSIGCNRMFVWKGIMAFRWTQKLDLDFKEDVGMVEYSLDSGATWRNAFTDQAAYNFYGFSAQNVDTSNGIVGFTGTDSVWRDIWLCFLLPISAGPDTVAVRFTLKSDSTDHQREGWMIDNMRTHLTVAHTVAETKQSSFFRVFPTNTSGVVFIEAIQSAKLSHRVERVELIDAMGRVVQRYKTSGEKYAIDISNQPSGTYHLRVFSNERSKTFSIMLNGR